MKQCSKCKKRKPFSEFNKNSLAKDGLFGYCRMCDNARNKKYQQTHKAKINNTVQEYHKTIIGCLRHRFNTIKQRCNNPKNKDYKNYGGRGIKCLFNSSKEFVDYVVNELKTDPRGLEIDRIDNNGYYEPDNIRIVTRKVNRNNRRH